MVNVTNTASVSSAVRDVNTMCTAADTTARSNGRSSRKQTPLSSIRETNVSSSEKYGDEKNFNQCSQVYIPVKKTWFFCQ